MKKFITIVGARPQIIKSAAISRAVSQRFSEQLKEVIVHTGQHYDENMSAVFFNEMKIPKPDYNLSVGSGSHGKQTAVMLEKLEEVYLKEKPDAVLVYGDTNSTIAGALAAAKIHIPVVHVEAGLRSFNKAMPEELNRISCDHMSTLLFTPTISGVKNLEKEGFSTKNKGKAHIDNPHVFHCGDVMFDNSMHFANVSDDFSSIIEKESLTKGNFVLMTVHRDSNTDVEENMNAIFKAVLELGEEHQLTFVLPLHPRTKARMKTHLSSEILTQVEKSGWIKIIDPVGFMDIIELEKNARMIVTDSGGLQKEAYFFQKPCVILRPQTEWVEIVNNGNALLAGADYDTIKTSFNQLVSKSNFTYPTFYGDGNAAEFICEKMLEMF